MRGVRFTKAEVYLIREAMERAADTTGMITGKAKSLAGTARSVLQKLAAATEPKAPGVAAQPFEAALIAAARGKVVSIDPKAYGRVSNMATAVGATVEGATLVGAWMATQKWLTGPLTVFTVLNKWPDWAARAKATAPPDGVDEGFAADVGQNPAQKRPATSAGRRAPGLG